MNIDRNISATQIIWACGLFLGLGIAVVLGSAVGSNDYQKVGMILGFGIGLSILLGLGKNYWLLIPFSLGAQFPAVPLGGRAIEFPELAIAGCSLLFLLRIAVRKEKLRLFHRTNIIIIAIILWVALVFAFNPIGLAMLGSSVGGGRFYIKLALAFASFVIMSNRSYSERDIKWVLGLLVFGAFFGMFFAISQYAVLGSPIDPSTGMIEDGFYTWHQVLSWPAFTVAFLIFARWSPREVFGFQRPVVLVLYIACFLLVLMSGKRMGLVAVLIAPAVSAIMYRQLVYIPIAVTALFVMVTTLVIGQGQWFSLPLVAQRTLSWLPGEWDSELEGIRGGADDWRAALRLVATENIKRDPLIGRGFAIDLGETINAVGMQLYDASIEAQTAAYALGRAWHNTWLGYAADFGIPFSIMQGVLWIWVLVLSGRVFTRLGNKSYLGVFCLYIIIFTVRDLLGSWTSGHSALDAFERWWMYGILVGIFLQTKLRDQTDAPEFSRRVPKFKDSWTAQDERPTHAR